jgi:hypothetical protein
VSTSGGDEALQGGVALGVVGVVVVPEAPDDLAPGAAEDACGVGVAGASGAGAVIDVGGPGVVAAACVRERVERVTEAVVAGPSELGVFGFAGLDGDGAWPASAARER